MEYQHHTVHNGGVQLHVVTLGEGPVVLMCHGMPGLWYSWRYQMESLASAGYKAVAFDQRGFGRSSRPLPVDDYTSHHTVADVFSILDTLKTDSAVLVGIDFGAAQVYNCAIRFPERVRAVVGMACPYDFDFSGRGCHGSEPSDATQITRPFARPDMSPNQCFAAIAEHQFFYAHYYQTPGLAENELGANPELFLKRLFWNLSAAGDLLDQSHWPEHPKGYCEVLKEPDQELPWPWMSVDDFKYYVDEFCACNKGSEFIGGINLYRAADKNWHINKQYCDENIRQPSLFIAGEHDPVLYMIDENAFAAFKKRSDDLRSIEIIKGAGHFVNMENPVDSNGVLLDFLSGLGLDVAVG
ncbi:MAG: alpha/beta hydrolase [Pseudomonadales bacterium]|nr:alpha/beta hydrolase [Pseudomonadales bacterium]